MFKYGAVIVFSIYGFLLKINSDIRRNSSLLRGIRVSGKSE